LTIEKRKIPWTKIKTDFIKNNLSYRDLQKKYGVSLYSIGQRGKKENWVELRADYHNKTFTKAIQKAQEKQSEKMAEEMILADQAAAAIIRLANSILQDPKQFNRHIVKLRTGYGKGNFDERLIEEEFDTVDTRRLKDLAAGLEAATRLSRTIKGILDEEAKQRLQIEREKLEIARKSAGIGNEDEEESGIIEIPAMAEPDEDAIELGILDMDVPQGGPGRKGQWLK
jgi:hypothetical protein